MKTLTNDISIKTEHETLSSIIRSRRTIYANNYINKSISEELLVEIIANGTWAPTHKHTEPWRFIVLEGKHQEVLGEFMLGYYKRHLSEDKFPESRYEHTLNYPKNATLVAIIFQRSKRIQIPEWEEIAAVSCAVQNIWLSCTANGIGGYWDTSEAAIKYVSKLDLLENERCLGLFYMGYLDPLADKPKSKRKPIHKKISIHSI